MEFSLAEQQDLIKVHKLVSTAAKGAKWWVLQSEAPTPNKREKKNCGKSCAPGFTTPNHTDDEAEESQFQSNKDIATKKKSAAGKKMREKDTKKGGEKS